MNKENSEERLLRIGKIVGFRGLQGEVKVRPASHDPDWVDHLERVVLRWERKEKELAVADARFQERIVYMRFEDVTDRTAAEKYADAEIFAYAGDLPDPGEGEYRVDDLVGVRVLDAESGTEKGRVKDVLTSAGSDFLEIELTSGEPEGAKPTVVVPFQDHFFPLVDIQAGFIHTRGLDDFFEDAIVSAAKAEDARA